MTEGKKNIQKKVIRQQNESRRVQPSRDFFSFFCLRLFLVFGRQPKNVPVADVWTEGVCMLFVYTLPYGTQYDHHNNQ